MPKKMSSRLLQLVRDWITHRRSLETSNGASKKALLETSHTRARWSNRWEFYLSCLGYAIGLGNVWRFPYLAYSLGGGSFVIAYFVVLIFLGIPMVMLELALGQYTNLSPVAAFRKLCPLFGGLGLAIVVNQFLICSYYSMVVAWTLYYLFASFSEEVPWSHCGRGSSPLCFSDQDYRACAELGGVYQAGCYTQNFAKLAGIVAVPSSLRITAAENFLNQNVLKISTSISTTGSPDWRLVLCLLLSWIICILCLIEGIKSSGKVVWFTTLFPLVCLVIFTIRGATLDNALDGIGFYIVPDWRQLASLTVWSQAAAQVFFNLSIGGGGLITYSSFNNFNYRFYYHPITLTLINGLVSLLAGIAVFSAMGFMASQLGIPVSRVIQDGPGLVFVAFPDAITRMPAPTIWAILFNLMLLCLGLDSQFAIVETVVSGICDEWPKLWTRKRWIIMGVCTSGFLIGLIFTTNAGLYWLRLFDGFVAGWPLILFGFCEVLVILLYGVQRFSKNIYEMIGRPVNWFYKALWYSIVPISTLFLVISDWITHKPVDYNGIPFPPWAQGVGWLMALIPVLLIPGYAGVLLLFPSDRNRSFFERLKASITAEPEEPNFISQLKWARERSHQIVDATPLPAVTVVSQSPSSEFHFKETHV